MEAASYVATGAWPRSLPLNQASVGPKPEPCLQQYKQTCDNSSNMAVHLPGQGITAIPARRVAVLLGQKDVVVDKGLSLKWEDQSLDAQQHLQSRHSETETQALQSKLARQAGQ